MIVVTGGAAGPKAAFCSGADLAPASGDIGLEKTTNELLDDTGWIGQFHLKCDCFSMPYELAGPSEAAVIDTKEPTAKAQDISFQSITYRQMCLERRHVLGLSLTIGPRQGPFKAHLGLCRSAEVPLTHPQGRAQPILAQCAPLRLLPSQSIQRDSLDKRLQPKCSASRSRSAKAC